MFYPKPSNDPLMTQKQICFNMLLKSFHSMLWTELLKPGGTVVFVSLSFFAFGKLQTYDKYIIAYFVQKIQF